MSLTPPAPANTPLIPPMEPDYGYSPSPVQGLANWQKEMQEITPQAGLL